MRINSSPFRKNINSLEIKKYEHSIVIITFIPFLSGHYRHKLKILKLCVNSIIKNTNSNFNLIIFDNNSCKKVKDYLVLLGNKHDFINLVLSSQNIGKIAAMNKSFKLADGNYVSFSDDDIFFKKNWFEESKKILDGFNNVGYVSALPVRAASDDKKLKFFKEKNKNLVVQNKWDINYDISFANSIGVNTSRYLEDHNKKRGLLIKRRNINAYLNGTHLQFTTTKKILKQVLPFKISKKNYQAQLIDEAFDNNGLFRLATKEMLIHHMGNFIKEEKFSDFSKNLLVNKNTSNNLSFIDNIQVFIFSLPIIRNLSKYLIDYLHNVLFLKYLKRKD